jgi:DNA-binding LacI/PurR family transcriptional regulator
VAAAAGVSAGTASKALNGRGKISAATRERVLRAARELAFVPNTLAQGLLAGRSFSVALVTPGTFGRLCLQVLLGAQDTLGASQIPVLIGEARGDPGRERRYLETFAARQVDGLIVAGRRPESTQGLRASPGIPVVHALGRAANGGFSVLPDVAGGARLAAEHLLGLGRRRVAHITGPECHASARLEASGFTAALRAAGVERCGPVMHGQRDESWGREAAGRLLPGRPDAIFCGSDQIARGAAETVRALGFRIPEDIALVGSGNWTPAALGTQPELTSVDLCLEEVGRVAAVYLLSAIAGEAPEGVHRVPPRLAVRRSTGGGDAGQGPAGPGRTGMPARQAAGRSEAPAMAGLGQRGGNDMKRGQLR